MTLLSLLNHVGVHVPRGVTIDGRVHIGHAAIAAHHVTAVMPHTFHGGDGPPHEPRRTPWWNDETARAADISAVSSAFPGFVLEEQNGGYIWRGQIDSGRGVFQVAVVGSPGSGLPAIDPISPRVLGRNEGSRGFRKAEHLYTNGSLCVADITDWDPAEHTTATAIAWAAHWFAAYTSWRITGGPWPTKGYQPYATA